MSDELVTIAEFTDYIQAELTQQKLADCGVESIVSQENAANLAPGFGMVKLMVTQSRAEKAREALRKIEGRDS